MTGFVSVVKATIGNLFVKFAVVHSAVTNSVENEPAAGVGALGVPVKVGLSIGAYPLVRIHAAVTTSVRLASVAGVGT